MNMNSIKTFREALEKKHHALDVLAKNGQKIMGYFCTYTPIEVIHAAGFIPVRVTGESETLTTVDMHVPGFTCPYLRKAFDAAVHGSSNYLSGIIQGYTCDAACGLIHIWKENIGGELFHTVPLPYNDTREGRAYLRSALDELAEKLQSIGGRNVGSQIDQSVRLYASIRERVKRLYEKRYSGNLALPAKDFYTIIQTAFVVPPEDYLDMLRQFMEDAEDTDEKPAQGIPVVVTGSIIEDLGYFDLIEACGGRIVGDDLCTGLRHFDYPEPRDTDPFDRIMERHFNRMPCPARSRATRRAQLLQDLVHQSGARGLIGLFQKFCTPHLADYPVIRDAFTKEGIPSMMLEMDEAGAMKGQIQTRLEGFFEMMEQ